MEMEERIKRQERLTQLLVLLLILFGAGGILGVAITSYFPTAVLKAKRIQLVGDAGEVLVAMTVAANGNGTITTHNSQGDVLVALGSDPSGNGVVSVYDAGGELMVRVGSDLNGEAEVKIFNRAGERIQESGQP